MSGKYLHLAVIFKGENLNYGESVGNILSLKKVASEGKNFSYISRQALRYDMVRMLREMYGYEWATVDREGGVVQFSTNSSIKDFPEIDFFGYMKTAQGSKIRKAVVRLTNAVSLEPFHNELDFSTNKGLADRISLQNDIYQTEIHRSHYCYTLTCSLDEIGKDEIDGIDLPGAEKVKRLQALMNVIKLLYRDIKGKRENLSPLFVIGGIYEAGNPFFYNRIKLSFTKDKTLIDAQMLNAVLKTQVLKKTVEDQTALGYVNGEFTNIDSINVPQRGDIEDFFKWLNQKVANHYNG